MVFLIIYINLFLHKPILVIYVQLPMIILGKKNEWRKYLNSLPMEVIFAYKNNLYKEKLSLEYHGEGLPCAFLLVEGKQTYFLTSDEINNISNLDELIRLVDNKLSNINN